MALTRFEEEDIQNALDVMIELQKQLSENDDSGDESKEDGGNMTMVDTRSLNQSMDQNLAEMKAKLEQAKERLKVEQRENQTLKQQCAR